MPGDASAIVETVAATAPDIRDGLPGRRVYSETENPSGEQQLAADIYADELLEERLLAVDPVAAYASEEGEGTVESDTGGEYHVALDPLDGSSNLRSNNAMGTILAVYDDPLPAPGTSLVASAYVLYGPITTMVVAHDGAVTEYVVDGAVGDGEDSEDGVELEPVEEDLALPDDPVVYGFGGRVPDWTDGFTAYAREIETEFKLRYGGAMIADVTQVLSYGGVFGYPMLEGSPDGKLRLGFEGHPVGKVIADAGGASSDGTASLLSRTPDSLHARSPVFVGSQALIDDLEAALAD